MMMKLTKEDKELIKKAEEVWKKYDSKNHSVSSIVISKSGKFFEGMSMEFDCGVGVCAERTALFKMMPEEKEIKIIVASSEKRVIPPCGVCRELMYEMHKNNLKNTWVIVSKKQKVRLKDLFPFPWEEAFH
jgi:cytidine deaminase